MDNSAQKEAAHQENYMAAISRAVFFFGLILFFAFFLTRPPAEIPVQLPDFRDFANAEDRKAAFLKFLVPYAEKGNEVILRDRRWIEKLQYRFSINELNKRERHWLKVQGAAYGLILPDTGPTEEVFEELLRRVDTVPLSMILAQAALESGWGTSRFAREGNNLFGVRCYEPGCGIVPENRPAGATFEVKGYPSPVASIVDFLRILNGNPAYAEFRVLREEARLREIPLSGLDLIQGLSGYSEEGSTYISKITELIQFNQLDVYDR